MTCEKVAQNSRKNIMKKGLIFLICLKIQQSLKCWNFQNEEMFGGHKHKVNYSNFEFSLFSLNNFSKQLSWTILKI